MAELPQQALADVLARSIPGYRSLVASQQLTAGASQETWRITLDTDDGTLPIALRRCQPTATSASSVGSISLATEAHLFQLAHDAGIPGPKIIYTLQPEDSLGEGFLMQWLDGETLGQRITRAEELAAVRPRLARECGRILARIHQLDWRAANLEGSLPVVQPAQLVEQTWQHYCDLDVPVPMIDYTWRWLRDNLPGDSRTTLVHGDFRNGNLMVTAQGINAVLDWELAHVGDPLRDLGWLCVNSWRFGERDKAVGGFGDIDELLSGYAEVHGARPSREALRFWQVFGSFWWAMATLQMAGSWRSGETPSLERPVIGRRSSEAQMDCVNLLLPGSFDLPQEHTIAAGTQLPSPAELLAGVATFLKKDIAPGLDAHDSFLARVGANSLRIAQREFQYGPLLAGAEHQRLQRLLGASAELDTLRWQLVRALRDDLPLDTPGLVEHLRQTVAGQLFIDQPRYSALHEHA